jgi:hypothetical protein
VILGALLSLAPASCSTCGDGGVTVPPVSDAAPPRRFADGPAPQVHAYPPHAIRADGVGPYLVDAPMAQIVRELPEGPHLELLQVGRYANWRVVRAEGGDVLIGADAKNEVAFISVLRAEVARTTSGVGVGATSAELDKALGPPVERGDEVRDRRIVEFASLPRARFVTDAGPATPPDRAKVVAVVVQRDEPRSTGAASPCRAGGPLAAARADVVAAARAKTPAAEAVLRFGCITGAAPEAVVLAGGELTVVGGEPGKLRRLAPPVPAPGAELFGLLDVEGDGRDEIVWGAERRTETEEALDLHLVRWDAGHLVEVLAERPVVIGEQTAAVAGVTPADIDLAVTVRAAAGALVVGGYYGARTGGRLRVLAPLSPQTLRLDLKHGGAAPPESRPAFEDAALPENR